MLYLVLKSLHLMAVISWMAGILYLVRLMVYHTENRSDPSRHDLLSTMEAKLYRIIALPAMAATWIFALGMVALRPDLIMAGWFHTKLLLVLALTVFTTKMGKLYRRNLAEPGLPSSRTLRLLNEVPTFIMILVVLLAILKPF